jgi:hypothetical protein
MGTQSGSDVQTVFVTLSITLPGGEQPPLVASRFLLNGEEVSAPFVFLLGRGQAPLAVVEIVGTEEQLFYAQLFSRLAASIVGQAAASLPLAQDSTKETLTPNSGEGTGHDAGSFS